MLRINQLIGFAAKRVTVTSGLGLYLLGDNTSGSQGRGNSDKFSSAVQVTSSNTFAKVVSSIGAGDLAAHAAIGVNGTLWTWGYNSSNAILGKNSTQTYFSSPTQVGELTTWADIAVGLNSMLAVKTDGTLWAWGSQNEGVLGLGATADISSPVQVGALTTWSKVYIGGASCAAIKTTGELFVWGGNFNGELGLGDTTTRSSPVQVGAATNYTKIQFGNGFAAHLRGGAIYTTGVNTNGQLGLGDTAARSSPVQVGALTTWTDVTAGSFTMLAVNSSNRLFGWGGNLLGELGNGTTTSRSSPVQVGALTDWSKVQCVLLTTKAIKTNNTLWGWGENTSGEIGDGTTTSRSSPVQIGALTTWSSFNNGSYTNNIIVKNTTSFHYTWGKNIWGLMNVEDDFTSPLTQLGLAIWADISGGSSFLSAIKTDGTLWTWGNNDSGQLGLGDTAARSSPVQVGALTTWSKVFSNFVTTYAIKTDGTLWAWGDNVYGQLGLGDTTSRSSPVQVGLLTNWTDKISFNGITILAIKSNGTLWAWGNNDSGQLGLADLTRRSSPVQVGALTDWSSVPTISNDFSAGLNNFSAAIRAGSLYSWGDNTNGLLGHNNTVSVSSPVQVGTLTNWSKISFSTSGCLAIKTDGTLWGWGLNNPSLNEVSVPGNGTLSFSSPVQIGALTNWSIPYKASHCNASIKTDNTIWVWGDSKYGFHNTTNWTFQSSPVQLGSISSWTKLLIGDKYMAAIIT